MIQVITSTHSWLTRIEQWSIEHFGYVPCDYKAHWWFVDIKGVKVRGFAGAITDQFKRDSLFIGPCVVFSKYRGRGIQRDFIQARESFAQTLGYNSVITRTEVDNQISANNLQLRDFKQRPPWHRYSVNDGTILYWEKKLG